MSRYFPVINGILFYIGWFICALGAARGDGLSGPLFVIAVVIFHLFVFRSAKELLLLAKVSLAGLLIETAFLHAGVFIYESPNSLPLAPWWIVALYTLLGTSLSGSLIWLRRVPAWSSILGAVGGTFCYVCGVKMGSIHYGYPWWLCWSITGVIWGIMMPIYCRWAAYSE